MAKNLEKMKKKFKSNLQFMKNVKWSNKGQENGNTPYCPILTMFQRQLPFL